MGLAVGPILTLLVEVPLFVFCSSTPGSYLWRKLTTSAVSAKVQRHIQVTTPFSGSRSYDSCLSGTNE